MKQAIKQRRKILYLITKGTWGGAQRYVYDLATHLPRADFEPIVAYGTAGQLSEDLARAGIATKHIPSLARDIAIISDIKSFFGILWIILKTRPDVVHLNSSKAAGLGALAARVLFTPKIIFTVHGWPFKEDRGSFMQMLIHFVSWMTAMMSHAIIVLSKKDKELGMHMRFVGKKMVHITLGIEPRELLPQKDARKAVVPPEIAARHGDDVWVGTVAELHPNKNLFGAIDAVVRYNETHLPHIFYCIIGEGELRTKLDAYITRRGVREHIFLASFVPRAEQYLSAFDVFFLSSKKEGLPYVLIEAAYAGLASIGSNIDGISDIIVPDESGLLRAPSDTEGFAEALYICTKDPEERVRLGQNLRRRAMREFALDTMCAKTLTLYRA